MYRVIMWTLLILALGSANATAKDPVQPIVAEALPLDNTGGDKAGPTVESILGDFTFDGPGGTLDPQGWVGVDAWAQTDTFFRVEDFAGIGGPGLPLSGAKSLWCGRRPNPANDCAQAQYPGYGNNWVQDFTSQVFVPTGPGDVNLTYGFRVDVETLNDILHVQYLGASGIWQTLATHYLFSEEGSNSVAAPGDSLAGSVRFRFLLESDLTVSDEDGIHDSAGAVFLDNIIVNGPGILAIEDFEDEPVGAVTTNDGAWSAMQNASFGNYVGLFDGSTVLQEDPLVTNDTGLWGFFQGSSSLCPEYGLQPVVPNGRAGSSELFSDFIFNEVRSQEIDLTMDQHGDPVIPFDALAVDFDVYRDLPLDSYVYYGVRVRYRVGGCLTPWDGEIYVFYGDGKDWLNQTRTFPVEAGATHVQVALFCKDICGTRANCDGAACHSQSPLFDNVTLSLFKDPLTVTTAANSGPGSLREAITQANLLPDHDRIVFDIAGSSVIELFSELPALLYPVEIDATTNPGYGSEPVVELDGNLLLGIEPALTLSDSCAVRGLAVHGFPDDGIMVDGDDCLVEGCHIGRSPNSELTPGNGGAGVFITDQAVDGRVGGPAAGQGNVITANNKGVVVSGSNSTGHAIRGNSIFNNTMIGIDLGNDLVTDNDKSDSDNGPNELQNFPEITLVNLAVGAVEASLLGRPNKNYEVDFFQSTFCSGTGNGEGQVYLGSQTMLTNSVGQGYVRFTTSLTLVAARQVTTTVTDDSGNTSEFSSCFEVPPAYIVTNLGDTGPGTLQQAILDANGDGLPSVVSFDVGGVGPYILTLDTMLPALTEQVAIDGFSLGGSVPNTLPAWEGINSQHVLNVISNGVTSGDGFRVQAKGCRIQGLAIGGFDGSGIRLEASGTTIYGCNIGVATDGSTAIGNSGAGVQVDPLGSKAGTSTIGGSHPLQRNLISSNVGPGILVGGNPVAIEGNLIGTDANGLVARPNFIGVETTTDQGRFCRIGGPAPESRNVISSNDQSGILLGAGAGYVHNNLVGVGVDGTTPMGNGTYGVLINSNINELGESAGNVIAHNGSDGIRILTGSNTTILKNEIHDNGLLGIDVEVAGPTPNPVSHTPVPVLTGVDTSLNRIYGTVTSSPNTSIRLQFFANAVCDPSGYGEGEVYLGESIVATDGVGVVSWTFNSPLDLIGGEFLAATAKHPTIGSSEFSLCLEAVNTPVGNDVVVNLGEVGNDVTLTFDNVVTPGNTSATSSSIGPSAPGSFFFGDPPVFWFLSTSAVFGDSIEVCLPYDPSTLFGDEADLVLLHWDEDLVPPAWVEITSSRDAGQDVICGRTSHLSPFAVAYSSGLSGVEDTLPRRLGLHNPAPNPFNPMTTIHFDVPASSLTVSLRIYDIRGRLVRSLAEGHLPAGRHRVVWQGTDDSDRGVASGVYFVRIDDGQEQMVRKLVLVE